MKNTHPISSIEEALAYLAQYADAVQTPPEISLTGDWSRFFAHIDGPQYNASVPGELARGLWEYQEALYRAVAFALYGTEDMRKLTSEQRVDFQLVFEISEGSTTIVALLNTFLEKLAEGITSMDSKHKALTIIAVAIVLGAGYGGVTLLEQQGDAKKEEIKASLAIAVEQEKTKQFEIFSDLARQNQVVTRFAKAGEEGARAIVKGASGAREIQIGSLTFDQDDIDEVRQRAAKDKAAAQLLVDDFLVFRAEFREKTSTKFLLANKETGEFQVTVSEEEIDADSMQKLWNAAKNRTPIKLEINATMIRNQVKSALLVRVI